MKIGHSTAIAITALLISGCTSQRIDLAAGPGQEAIVRDGVPALVSKKRHLVMLRPNNRLLKGNARPAFTLVVRNMGGSSETLLESKISAQQLLGGKTASVRFLRYDELVKEESDRQTAAAIGATLAGVGRAMSASNAGYVTTNGTVNAYSPYGSSVGTYSATTYDPLRAQLAQQAANTETEADFANLAAQGERNLAGLQQTILKDNTVMPGEWYGGTIVLEPPERSSSGPTSYSIAVDFGGETHIFQVSQVEG